MAAGFSLKKLISLILGIIGIFFLIFILVKGASIFFPGEEVSESQDDTNNFANAVENLKSAGDFTRIPFEVSTQYQGGKTFELYSLSEKKKPYILVTFQKGENVYSGVAYLDVPICTFNKISKEPCVEGYQQVRAWEKEDGSIFYNERDEDLFDSIPRKSGYITDKKSIELRVSDSGRLLLLAPN